MSIRYYEVSEFIIPPIPVYSEKLVNKFLPSMGVLMMQVSLTFPALIRCCGGGRVSLKLNLMEHNVKLNDLHLTNGPIIHPWGRVA